MQKLIGVSIPPTFVGKLPFTTVKHSSEGGGASGVHVKYKDGPEFKVHAHRNSGQMTASYDEIVSNPGNVEIQAWVPELVYERLVAKSLIPLS